MHQGICLFCFIIIILIELGYVNIGWAYILRWQK